MDIDDSQHNELPSLFENIFPEPIESGLVDYCDVHDLVAVVFARTQNVAVFRINGQQAFAVPRKDASSNVSALKWKPDGSLLGIGWSDGSTGVYSGEDGKLMSLTSARSSEQQDDWKLDLRPDEDVHDADQTTSATGCMGWTIYASTAQQQTSKDGLHPQELSTEEWYDEAENGRDDTKPVLASLARSIATLDVTTVLPRLSALPVHALRFGPGEQKFTTQSGLDSLLDINRTSTETVNTFITSDTSGTTHVFLDDSVSLGQFAVEDRDSQSLHASHPQCTSQVIASDTEDDKHLSLHYIDLPLERLSGSLLHVVTANTKRIQNLVAYITQTIRCMQTDLTTNLQFQDRVIENISEDLSTNHEDDIVTNLYHLAMGGVFTPTMLEWLTESIRENQQKRWDKSINDMYNHIQNHIFVHLIPALDRLAIAANAIRGHAKARADTGDFISAEPFTSLMDDVDSIRLVAQRIQLLIMTEHRQFRAFSKWLRVMVEVGIAGPNSKGAIEIEEREVPNLDYNLILAYISETLLQTKMMPYLRQTPEVNGTCTESEFWQNEAIVTSSRENIVRTIASLNDSSDPSPGVMLNSMNLQILAVRLAGQGRAAISTVGKWQSGMLPSPVKAVIPCEHSQPFGHILDVAMGPHDEHGRGADSYTCVLAVSTSRKEISFTRITRRLAYGVDHGRKVCEFTQGTVLDAELVDHLRCVMLLREEAAGRYTLVLCHSKLYKGWNDCEEGDPPWLQELHSFDGSPTFEPSRFVIGGRPGKMVCVAFSDRTRTWRVLDLGRAYRE